MEIEKEVELQLCDSGHNDDGVFMQHFLFIVSHANTLHDAVHKTANYKLSNRLIIFGNKTLLQHFNFLGLSRSITLN